jgi:small subunit ribosomal protein S20
LAHHKSCIKRIKTNEKARLQNRQIKSSLRSLLKKLQEVDKEGAVKVSKQLCAEADNAARKGVIHRNKAAHLKSKAQKTASATG